jgi:hypothetical protein
MTLQTLAVMAERAIMTIPEDEISMGRIITCLAIAGLLIIPMLIFRQRIVKILCACSIEVCLFLACRLYFGYDSIVTQIMCWFTAAVACIVTVAIVNRINWGNLRGKRDI